MADEIPTGQPTDPLPLDYRTPAVRKRGPSADAVIGKIMLFVFLPALLISIVLPMMGRSREPSKRVMCAANLKYIGRSMHLYANKHGGIFPDSFETMILSGDLDSPGVLVCPSSDDERPAGATPSEIMTNLTAEPGHLSFVYAAKGLTIQCPGDAVLAYDRQENHGADGINVLYGDGNVEFILKAQAEKMIAELQSGHNPPRPEMLK